MANITTKKINIEPNTKEIKSTPVEINKETDIIAQKDNQIKELQSQMDELKGMVNAFISMNNNQPTIIDTASKMDKPYTLIHLLECPSDLPTVIDVNGIKHYFTRFGEERVFRYADMQNLVSRYRNWFERGILTLGDDCIDKKDEFGINAIKNQIPVSTYNKIETLSDVEFENLIEKINDIQRIHLVQMWVSRYDANRDGYNDVNKIRILNKYTKDKTIFKNGILHDLLKDVIDGDEDKE